MSPRNLGIGYTDREQPFLLREPLMSAPSGPPPTPAERSASEYDWRLGRFPKLMMRRIQEVLLVSSAYDSFILEEDGLLTEMIYNEYIDLGLTHAPNITRVPNGEAALARIGPRKFDLVITMLRLGNMDVGNFERAVHRLDPQVPVVLLMSSEWELSRVMHQHPQFGADSLYVWHGDAKLFLAIIKSLEDRLNAEHDTRAADVGVIILVEDSVGFRSSLLPLMYSELVKQTRAVMAESLNPMDRRVRMRARPKILVADTFEQGMDFYRRFHRHVFGVVADVSFPRAGRLDPQAGVDFIREIKHDMPDVPAVLQSSDIANARFADQIGASFLHKRSATLLDDLRNFMLENFGFGDFVFRLPDGREVGRARDLQSMATALEQVPLDAILFHARRNHFSNWLRARTEFALARRMRPRKVSEFRDLEALRAYLVRNLNEAIRRSRRGVVEDYARQRFDPSFGIARIGGGSLGGKARGLAFVDALLAGAGLEKEFRGIEVRVPPSVVLGTDLFDEFLDFNRLRHDALRSTDDDWLTHAFLRARLPDSLYADLRTYVENVQGPLAVRSSSLLEDSQYHPFAGVYSTFMLPNNHADGRLRLAQLGDAIRLVYASTFRVLARRYLDSTPHRIEEEKMAVILQPLVGARHGDCFYPDISGVARSFNYYPYGAMRPEDGVVSVALGLGKTVVEGGQTLRFCPAWPQVLPELADAEEFLNRSQRAFYAVNVGTTEFVPTLDGERSLVQLEIEAARAHGTLAAVGSAWSPDDNTFHDGIHRPGVPAVTFAPILKHEAFPLAALLQRLLEIGRTGMNSPIEIEFAANLQSQPRSFAVLQLRPCATAVEVADVELGDCTRPELLCYSQHALGNGIIRGLRDIVYVRPAHFDSGLTMRVAEQIRAWNDHLMRANRPYILIGPGRWGSSHPRLGIPVQWPHISAARIIIETTLADFVVEPSQGSHFFQNLTAFGTVYLTINSFSDDGFIDWEWLDAQPATAETPFVRHVTLPVPLEGRVNGSVSRAVILKRAPHVLGGA